MVPLVGLLRGLFLAYVGSLRLWDLAGSLPLLHRLHFSVTRLRAEQGSAGRGDTAGSEAFLEPGIASPAGTPGRGGVPAGASPGTAGWSDGRLVRRPAGAAPGGSSAPGVRVPLGLKVGPENYFLDPDDSYRWGVRGGVLICPPSEEEWIRKAFKV